MEYLYDSSYSIIKFVKTDEQMLITFASEDSEDKVKSFYDQLNFGKDKSYGFQLDLKWKKIYYKALRWHSEADEFKKNNKKNRRWDSDKGIFKEIASTEIPIQKFIKKYYSVLRSIFQLAERSILNWRNKKEVLKQADQNIENRDKSEADDMVNQLSD